jgi:hypothetical protein
VITIAKSENSSFVLRKTSLTTRERLIPEMACSTLTRTREIFRLCRFSAGVSSPLRGFFSVGAFEPRVARILESHYLCTASTGVDTRCLRCQQFSCHWFCRHTSGSSIQPVWSWCSQSPHSCHYRFSSCRCRAKLVFERLLAFGDAFRCHQWRVRPILLREITLLRDFERASTGHNGPKCRREISKQYEVSK